MRVFGLQGMNRYQDWTRPSEGYLLVDVLPGTYRDLYETSLATPTWFLERDSPIDLRK